MMKKNTTVALVSFMLLLALASCQKNVVDVRDFAIVRIDSVFPAAGPSGAYVEVYGNNFPYKVTETAVTIDGKNCTIIKSSPQKLLIRIPDNARSGPLHFWFDRRNPMGDKHNYSDLLDSTAVWPSFVVDDAMIAMPLITKSSPAAGKPGTVVTLEGYNFNTTTGVLKVMFGETAGQLVSVTPEKLTVKVPLLTPVTLPIKVQQGPHTVAAGNFTVDEIPAGTMYYISGMYTEEAGIFKMELDATGEPVIEKLYGFDDGLFMPDGLHADAASGKLYWAEDTRLMQGSMDGTAPVEVLYEESSSISDIVLVNGAFYYSCYSVWAPGGNAIKKLTAGGTPETLYMLRDDDYPESIRVDGGSGKLYWRAGGKIYYGSMEGAPAQPPAELFNDDVLPGDIASMAIDPVTHTVYIRNNNREIYKGAGDGSGALQKLAVNPDYLLMSGNLEIDPVKGFLFWKIEGDEGLIYRCKLDGTGAQEFARVRTSVSAIEPVF